MSTPDFTDPRDSDTLRMVERSLPRVTPSEDLFDRILADIGQTAPVVPLESARAARRTLDRRVIAGAIAGLAAVAAAVAIAIGIGDEDQPAPAATMAIVGKEDRTVAGEAEMYDVGSSSARLVVNLENVPPAPSGHHYEVWVLRKGSEEMEAVGAFSPDSTSVSLELPLPGAGDYAAVDISVEEDGGNPAHSGVSLAGGAA